jgi:hypothetical protein
MLYASLFSCPAANRQEAEQQGSPIREARHWIWRRASRKREGGNDLRQGASEEALRFDGLG